MEEEFNRRQSDRFKQESQVRRDIMEQMQGINDPAFRVVLTLMLRMQDETQTEIASMSMAMQAYMHQITVRLDKLTKTEEEIRKSVLNGHADSHHADHDYLKELRKREVSCASILNQHGDDGLCEHARQMMEDKAVSKRRQWKVMDSVVEKAVWVGLMFLAGLVGAKVFPGVFG